MLRIHGEMKKIKSPALDLKAMEKIRDELGWSPRINFEDGIKELLNG